MANKAVVPLLLFELLAITTTAYVPKGSTDVYIHHPGPVICPDGCQCNTELKKAQCQLNINQYTLESLLPWQLQKLRIVGDEVALKEAHRFSSVEAVLKGHDKDLHLFKPEIFQNVFSHLYFLEINYFPLTVITDSDLRDFTKLSFLSLAFNNISEIGPRSFENLVSLEVLNLTGNKIGELSDNVFVGMSQLTSLYLESNGLSYISELAFHGLHTLRNLYLQNNNIRSLESFIGGLSELSVLSLGGNKISYVLNSSVEVLKEMDAVDLGSNPFECSCVIASFVEAVREKSSSLKAMGLKCAEPDRLRGQEIMKLDMTAIPCYTPIVTTFTNSLDVVFQSSVTLSCQANGTAPLGIYWMTPWGDVFASSHVQHIFPELLHHATADKLMHGINTPIISRVYVTPDNYLHLENFRGMFAGIFTCVGVGFTGIANQTMEIDMHTKLPEIYMASIYIGVYCTVSMLTVAIFIGSVRWFVYKCLHSEGCHCCCCRSDECSIEDKDDKSEPVEIVYESSYACATADESDYQYYDEYPPCPPVNSPQERLSPEKSYTPNEETDPSKFSPHIWEQLDEVRARLRYGAERKIEQVRSHVRSITDTGSLKIRNIKDAGTMKIQSIKETGSHAALRMKKNVASGMVQVKYGVQSIKEFCGTGEMGTGTISMVSVSTDVDTKEQVKIVKSHTFV